MPGFALNVFGAWLLWLWFALRYCCDLSIVLLVGVGSVGFRGALIVDGCLVGMRFGVWSVYVRLAF